MSIQAIHIASRAHALRSGVLAGLVVGALGCAGSQTDVTAEGARYPISFSGVLVDADGKPLYREEHLEVVGRFEDSATKLGFLYAATGFDYDLGEEVNEQVEAAGGEGVVDLTVVASQCATNYFWPLTLIPVWPGCASMSASGSIVKRRATRTSEDPGRVSTDAINAKEQP